MQYARIISYVCNLLYKLMFVCTFESNIILILHKRVLMLKCIHEISLQGY